ncbi:hypothetical protein FGB62_43g18 [Gracilaria domingensis]|nr:hypothetical protein FGB62_43g18 [Gracilaria domingensis]
MAVVDSVSDSADTLFSNFNEYAASHQDGIVALLLFVGVIVTFAGRVLLTPTVFLLGFIPSSTAITAFAFAFIEDRKPSHPRVLGGVSMVVAAATGTLVGIIMLRLLFRIATFVLCAGFGAVIVLVVHLFLLEPSVGSNALIILYSIVILCALLSGLFSVSYPEPAIILGTSFDGAAVAVFSLARFLGHRPKLLAEVPEGSQIPAVWAIGYASATLLLGIFGAMTQWQVALADRIVAAAAQKANPTNAGGSKDNDTTGYSLQGDQHQILLSSEPPRTPTYEREPLHSPIGTSTYGAVEQEDQYTVLHNIGAGPLPDNLEMLKNAKDTKLSHTPL